MHGDFPWRTVSHNQMVYIKYKYGVFYDDVFMNVYVGLEHLLYYYLDNFDVFYV